MTGRSGLGGYKGFTHPQWIGRLLKGVPDLKGWATSGLWDRNPVAECFVNALSLAITGSGGWYESFPG